MPESHGFCDMIDDYLRVVKAAQAAVQRVPDCCDHSINLALCRELGGVPGRTRAGNAVVFGEVMPCAIRALYVRCAAGGEERQPLVVAGVRRVRRRRRRRPRGYPGQEGRGLARQRGPRRPGDWCHWNIKPTMSVNTVVPRHSIVFLPSCRASLDAACRRSHSPGGMSHPASLDRICPSPVAARRQRHFDAADTTGLRVFAGSEPTRSCGRRRSLRPRDPPPRKAPASPSRRRRRRKRRGGRRGRRRGMKSRGMPRRGPPRRHPARGRRRSRNAPAGPRTASGCAERKDS